MAVAANTSYTATYHVTNDSHHMMAKNYISAVNRMDPPHYFFFGRGMPWNDTDDCPTTVSDYYLDEREIRSHAIYLERIKGTEVSHVIHRYDWTAGQVYDRWDPRISDIYPAYSGATEIFLAKMFCMTTDYHIYKCIDNNGNSPTFSQPTGTSTDYIYTSDGYVWKYMMTLDEYSRLAFLNESWIPIQNAIHATTLNSGITVSVDDPGTGYDPENTIIVINGDGLGAHVRPRIIGGQIVGIEVIEQGSGYSYAEAYVSTPDMTKPRGTGALLSVDFPIIDLGKSQSNVQLTTINGDISSLTVELPGDDYSSASVVIKGNGTGATATATVVDGKVTALNIVTRGSGYTYATVEIIGDGFGATGYAICSPSGGHGHDIVEESRSRVVATKKTIYDIEMHGVTDWPDFRQCGIWTHPDKTPVTTEYRRYYTASIGTPCWAVHSPQIFKDDFALDQKLVRLTDQTEWYVVGRADTTLILQSLTGHSIIDSDVFYDDLGAYAFAAEYVVEPDVVRDSGLIMFYDNSEVYHAVEDSSVQATIYIEF